MFVLHDTNRGVALHGDKVYYAAAEAVLVALDARTGKEVWTTTVADNKSAYYITLTGLPAISVPAGFTDDGLPVGLQIVGRFHDDFGVLQLAHAFEEQTAVWKRRPALE